MTTEELAAKMIRDAADALKEGFRTDAMAAPLGTDGDEERRLAATKHQLIEDIVIQLTGKAITP